MTRRETEENISIPANNGLSGSLQTKPNFFDAAIVGDPQATVDFIPNILESSTEYSVIAKDLAGKILLSNAGARGLYGNTVKETIGKDLLNLVTHVDSSWRIVDLP